VISSTIYHGDNLLASWENIEGSRSHNIRECGGGGVVGWEWEGVVPYRQATMGVAAPLPRAQLFFNALHLCRALKTTGLSCERNVCLSFRGIKVYKIIVTNKSSHILYGDTSS